MTEVIIEKPKSIFKEIWELVSVVVQALLIALVIRTFIFAFVVIPTGSMVPTLLIGDYLYVSKYAYGYSKHSFPYATLPFEGRIFGSAPDLGDIVVFKGADNVDYIKRLIGLPGDKVQMLNGILHINGLAALQEKQNNFKETDKYGNQKTVERFVETLPNGLQHNVLNYGNTRADNTSIYEIPQGHYFMMGDSRDNSNDSRFQDVVKMVPFEDFIGRADFTLLSFANGGSFWKIWNWPKNLRTDRMFQSIYTLENDAKIAGE